MAYGDGAVWVTNFVRDELVRVDVRTNEVTETIRLAGTPPSVAATTGAAWVSIAGARGGDSLPVSACGPVLARGDRMFSSPQTYRFRAGSRAQPSGRRRSPVRPAGAQLPGRTPRCYQSCDDSTAQAGIFDFIKCASNAKLSRRLASSA